MESQRLVLLAVAMVVYLCVGAAVFTALEAGPERDRKETLETKINQFIGKQFFYMQVCVCLCVCVCVYAVV